MIMLRRRSGAISQAPKSALRAGENSIAALFSQRAALLSSLSGRKPRARRQFSSNGRVLEPKSDRLLARVISHRGSRNRRNPQDLEPQISQMNADIEALIPVGMSQTYFPAFHLRSSAQSAVKGLGGSFALLASRVAAAPQ